MVRTSPATMTNMPIRNCMTRSFMTPLVSQCAAPPGEPFPRDPPSAPALERQFPEPFAGLAADELADAGVGVIVQPLGGAVVEDLRLAGVEPRQRVEHHD